ncbi:Thioredoxin [anaerobic digester metagenome]|nr:thioredoxin family protein [Lentimicrobiaceae bacterium]
MGLITTTDQNFKQLLSEHPRVVVKYYADWCGSCKLFAPKYRRLADDNRFEGVAFLDVNAEQNPEARKEAGVNNLPFFATFIHGKLNESEATSKEDRVVSMIENLKEK